MTTHKPQAQLNECLSMLRRVAARLDPYWEPELIAEVEDFLTAQAREGAERDGNEENPNEEEDREKENSAAKGEC
jgi:hypothetical protein